jgi:PD-(D/E)XK nuclease superfamily
VVYNPWSALCYINKDGQFAPYWVNTGSDVLLRHLLAEGPTQVRQGVEALVQGDGIRSVINDKLAFPDLLVDQANVWSFMLFSGYLKASDPMPVDELIEYRLEVPNREIKSVFTSIIRSWINAGPVKNDQLQVMLQALNENNMNIFQRVLSDFVVNTLSYYDTSGRDPEKVYQAFLLGMLVSSGAYEVSSNREAGLGRYDILMRPRDIRKRGFIMELKVCESDYGDTPETVLASALQQIEDKQYESVLRAAGVTDILKMAITFDGKRVWVKTAE